MLVCALLYFCSQRSMQSQMKISIRLIPQSSLSSWYQVLVKNKTKKLQRPKICVHENLRIEIQGNYGCTRILNYQKYLFYTFTSDRTSTNTKMRSSKHSPACKPILRLLIGMGVPLLETVHVHDKVSQSMTWYFVIGLTFVINGKNGKSVLLVNARALLNIR